MCSNCYLTSANTFNFIYYYGFRLIIAILDQGLVVVPG